MDRYEYRSFHYPTGRKDFTPRRKGYIRTVLYAVIAVSLIIFA